MAHSFEADVALIHVAGGSSRATAPPGTIAQSAPRRAARGREKDLIFLSLSLHPDRTAAPGLTSHLAHLGATAYFNTAGSVTAGLREVAAVVNEHLLDANQMESETSRLRGRLIAGVLRENNFYIAQCGIGQAILIRSDLSSRLTSEQAAKRPLGLAITPHVRYHHLEVQEGDIVLLTTGEPPVWPDAILNGLKGLSPPRMVERLTEGISRELTGMVVGIAKPGDVDQISVNPLESIEIRGTQAAQAGPRTAARQEPSLPSGPSALSLYLRRIRAGIRSALSSSTYFLAKTMARLSPGLDEPAPGRYSPRVLALTAILVPLFIVAIASLVYFQQGRTQQFDLNVADAQAAFAAAESKGFSEAAREDLIQALFWIEEAERYGSSETLRGIKEEVQSALDRLDLVLRIDYRPALSGGFGSDASLASVVATSTDLYVLDSANNNVWHLWWFGNEFDLDGEFQCLGSAGSEAEEHQAVDIALLPEPSALDAESIVVLYSSGEIVYCAPDKTPSFTSLTIPDIGWEQITALDVYNERLYLLDAAKNVIWLYDATDGLITGNPSLYFIDQSPDLSDAIDLVGTQEGLLILHADGSTTLCSRSADASGEPGLFQAECSTPVFRDDRPEFAEGEQIPGVLSMEVHYVPPPEPAIFFLDNSTGALYQYSLNFIYQARYIPKEPFEDSLRSFTIGSPNHIYIASGDQVYYAQMVR